MNYEMGLKMGNLPIAAQMPRTDHGKAVLPLIG